MIGSLRGTLLDRGHDAELLSLFGVDFLTRKQERASAIWTENLGPDNVHAVAGHHAARHMRLVLEIGVVGANDDVAHHGDLGMP